MFGQVTAIALNNGVLMLLVRMINTRCNLILEDYAERGGTQDKMMQKGVFLRRMHEFPLLRHQLPMFDLSWRIMQLIMERLLMNQAGQSTIQSIGMGRFLRHILYLLIACLLVSAGGIASSQTLSADLPFDQQVTGSPLKVPHKDRLQAAYSVANRHQVGLTRQINMPTVCQSCLRVIRFSQARRKSAPFASKRFSFTQRYPEGLSPPPRRAAV